MPCTDPVVLDLWHPVGATAEIARDTVHLTTLLERRVAFALDAQGNATAWLSTPSLRSGDAFVTADVTDPLPAITRYGYLWTSLGNPPAELFAIPEYDEADRRNLNGMSIGVHVSAPRAIENFLDMGHFPYVHTDILGAEPHTEVKEYDVEISVARDEILATRCRFFQPKSSAASTEGADIEYVYRVPHPFCSVLYKSSMVDTSRLDVIAVFLQPVDQEHVHAHMLVSVLDDVNDDGVLRNFQQLIFAQDQPILENQFPKRLPLDPRAETPIRADKSAIAYRRWLSQKGMTYGVIPAPN